MACPGGVPDWICGDIMIPIKQALLVILSLVFGITAGLVSVLWLPLHACARTANVFACEWVAVPIMKTLPMDMRDLQDGKANEE